MGHPKAFFGNKARPPAVPWVSRVLSIYRWSQNVVSPPRQMFGELGRTEEALLGRYLRSRTMS